MPDEPILREKARTTMQSGKLPTRRPDRIWGEPGVNAPCAVCERPVERDEMEVEFIPDDGSPHCDVFHIHVRCFAEWEFERGKARRTTAS